jgi:hypothetical protein
MDEDFMRKIGNALTLATIGPVAVLAAIVASNQSADAGVSVCSTSIDNPHYSKAAQGVVYEVRVPACGLTGDVIFHGTLSSGPQIGPLVIEAMNNSTHPVKSGKTATVSVVSKSAPCNPNLWYQGHVDISGLMTNTLNSQRVQVKCA